MKKRQTNAGFLEFHTSLMGYDFEQNGKIIPKYILFYRGYRVDKLKFNRYVSIKAITK